MHAAAVTASGRAEVEAVLAPTGRVLWVDREADLDAVTALSGSGPAYVFYVAEAMVRAAVAMGLSAEQGRELALATFAGATALALAQRGRPRCAARAGHIEGRHDRTPRWCRSRRRASRDAFVRALEAARQRAQELGDQFG